MQLTSLNIFSTIFNWILEKILSPVFSFISNLLEKVLGWIFKEILGPLLKDVLWPLIELAIKTVMKVLAGVIYQLFASLLKLVDTLEEGFDIFIGLRQVSSASGGKGSLLEVIFQFPTVKMAFWMILVIGLGIALLLTIYATAKSAFDLDFENKRPVSKVLTSFMKTFLHFFAIPFLVYVMIRLSGTVLTGIQDSLGGRNVTLGRMVFVTASLDASKTSSFNISSGNRNAGIGIDDECRRPFYVGNKDYSNVSEVEAVFDLDKFDYLIGFGIAIFLLIVMAACLIVFVQRIFDILVLYVASPFFVAMMPLDDGEKFGKWRELFLGKCFSGFGSVAAMKLYMILCPIIMGNDISFAEESSVEATYLIKIIFITGGAWAVYKSGSLITSLISSPAGSTEQGTMEAGAVFAVSALKMGGNAAASGVSWGYGKMKGMSGGNDSAQKFEDMRKEAPGSSGIPGISELDAEKAAERKAEKKAAEVPVSSESEPAVPPSVAPSGQVPKIRPKRLVSFGPGLGIDMTRNGKKALAVRWGDFFTAGHDAKGNFHLKILGAAMKWDSQGTFKSGGFRLFGKEAFQMKKGSDGAFHLNRLNILGAGFKRDKGSGSLYFSQLSMLGLKREIGPDQNAHLTNLGLIGLRREKLANGEYRTTSNLWGAVQKIYAVDKDKRTSVYASRILGMNVMRRYNDEEKPR